MIGKRMEATLGFLYHPGGVVLEEGGRGEHDRYPRGQRKVASHLSRVFRRGPKEGSFAPFAHPEKAEKRKPNCEALPGNAPGKEKPLYQEGNHEAEGHWLKPLTRTHLIGGSA